MPPSRPPPKGLTVVVALLSMIGPFTIDTYLPSFPDIEAEFVISRGVLSQSIALYMLAFAFSTLVCGALADRYGRRGVILVALVAYLLASIGCAMAGNYTGFLFFRLLQGVAAGGFLVTGRTMIRDVHDSREAQRAMSHVMLLFALAPALAPIIGGWLHDLLGWRSVFWFLALFSLMVFALMLRYIPETLHPMRRQSVHPRRVAGFYARTLTHGRFRSLMLLVTSFFGGLFIYIVGSPSVIFDYLGLGTNDFSVMFVPMVAGLMVGSWISGRMAHHWAPERTSHLALVLMGLAVLLNSAQALWLAPGIVTMIAPLVLYSCGVGAAMPALMILALDCFPDHRGSASGMHGFVQTLGIALLASLVVPLLLPEPAYMALGQFVLLAIAALLWWRIPDQDVTTGSGP